MSKVFLHEGRIQFALAASHWTPSAEGAEPMEALGLPRLLSLSALFVAVSPARCVAFTTTKTERLIYGFVLSLPSFYKLPAPVAD